jgi:ribosome modulation factor
MVRKASTEWAYKKGYEAARKGEMIGCNPYDSSQPSSKYAWLGGYNDYLAGHKLDLNVFKEE